MSHDGGLQCTGRCASSAQTPAGGIEGYCAPIFALKTSKRKKLDSNDILLVCLQMRTGAQRPLLTQPMPVQRSGSARCPQRGLQRQAMGLLGLTAAESSRQGYEVVCQRYLEHTMGC